MDQQHFLSAELRQGYRAAIVDPRQNEIRVQLAHRRRVGLVTAVTAANDRAEEQQGG